jgi:hypothetical protein
VATIVGAECGSDPETAFCKVETVAGSSPDAIVRHPADQRLIDAALKDEILEQAPDWIVGESGDHSGFEAEAAFQSAGDVVFASAFAYFEGSGGGNAPVTGIEAQHDFPEAYQIPSAIFFIFDLQWHSIRPAKLCFA